MIYNEFGKTGINLSVFGFGGAKFRNGKTNEENAELVRYAIGKGINHFDSCVGYANSEEVFGLAVKGLKRDSFYMSAKSQPAFYKAKREQLDEINRSLDKMKLDYFDFYYMWNVKRYSEYEQAIRGGGGGQYEALLDAQAQGLVRHICLSSHLNALEAIKIIDDGKIEGILLNLNILNFPYTIEAAVHAKKAGIGVGIMSPLYGGQIPSNESRLSFLHMNGLPPTGAALSFASGLWCTDYAYVGFGTEEEIDYACEIVDLNISIREKELGEIRKKVGAGLEKACCGCNYCMPYCPAQIPIAEYMLFYNLKYVFGNPIEEFEKKLAASKQWFMLAKRKADAKDCMKCGKCERECTQHIPVMSRIAELAEIEARLNI